MNLLLKSANIKPGAAVSIAGSKSETNRLFLLQALFPQIVIENASDSDDSELMSRAFESLNSQVNTQQSQTVDIHHAGTAMRFLTAFFAIQEDREVVLTGSSRMKERPIKILVDALRQLGADISYEEKEGFPPLRISGKKLSESKVTLQANVSSQYISALLLIAPKLENGLELTLEGEITSEPYIKMTLELLGQLGIDTSFIGNKIKVNPKSQIPNLKSQIVESDWSSASYYYSIVALSAIGTEIRLSGFKEYSLQGDSVLVEIYKDFGVETVFFENSISLKKVQSLKPETLNCDLNKSPDIAQTIAVTCFGLGIGCLLTGLHTLKIKETDRLLALKNELSRLGATVSITEDSISISASDSYIKQGVEIKTYQDHRMAMAFAPLAVKVPVVIAEAEVVSKSYPGFWEDLKSIGFEISEM